MRNCSLSDNLASINSYPERKLLSKYRVQFFLLIRNNMTEILYLNLPPKVIWGHFRIEEES